jgi:hypothetical protein
MMLFAWWKRQWPQISTKIGLVLTGIGPVLANYQVLDPRFGYAAAGVGVLAVIWNGR